MSWFALLVLACTTPQPEAPLTAEPSVVTPEPEPVPEPEPEPLPEPTEPYLAASHIQIPWQGAVRAPTGLARTEDEARELANRLHEQIAAGASFEELARQHSSDPSGRRGGRLGTWATGLMDADFERCTAAAAIGELGPVCRTPYGWQVVRREPLAAIGGSHVALPLPDDPVAASTVRTLAEELRQAWASGQEPEGAETVVPVGPGQLLPQVEASLRGLAPGEVGPIVEAGGALHVVRRAP